jgi:hypothetical protein
MPARTVTRPISAPWLYEAAVRLCSALEGDRERQILSTLFGMIQYQGILAKGVKKSARDEKGVNSSHTENAKYLTCD